MVAEIGHAIRTELEAALGAGLFGRSVQEVCCKISAWPILQDSWKWDSCCCGGGSESYSSAPCYQTGHWLNLSSSVQFAQQLSENHGQ